jgi:hypothetical protein
MDRKCPNIGSRFVGWLRSYCNVFWFLRVVEPLIRRTLILAAGISVTGGVAAILFRLLERFR